MYEDPDRRFTIPVPDGMPFADPPTAAGVPYPDPPVTPVTLVPGKSDAELAEDFKQRLREVYAPLCTLLDEIEAAGFFANINTAHDAFGRTVIGTLLLAKKF